MSRAAIACRRRWTPSATAKRLGWSRARSRGVHGLAAPPRGRRRGKRRLAEISGARPSARRRARSPRAGAPLPRPRARGGPAARPSAPRPATRQGRRATNRGGRAPGSVKRSSRRRTMGCSRCSCTVSASSILGWLERDRPQMPELAVGGGGGRSVGQGVQRIIRVRADGRRGIVFARKAVEDGATHAAAVTDGTKRRCAGKVEPIGQLNTRRSWSRSMPSPLPQASSFTGGCGAAPSSSGAWRRPRGSAPDAACGQALPLVLLDVLSISRSSWSRHLRRPMPRARSSVMRVSRTGAQRCRALCVWSPSSRPDASKSGPRGAAHRRSSGSRPWALAGACGRSGRCVARAGSDSRAGRCGTDRGTAAAGSNLHARRRSRSGCAAGAGVGRALKACLISSRMCGGVEPVKARMRLSPRSVATTACSRSPWR